jgi:hypothetical protein
MAQSIPQGSPAFSPDDDIAESIRVIERQRSVKLIAVLVAIVVAFVAAFAVVYLAYSDELTGAPAEQR